MAERVDLDQERKLDAFLQPQVDQAVEDFFPILVPGEIVVGNKETVQPLGHVLADKALHIVRGTPARLASLDVDDCAERTLEWATASRVKARHRACRPDRANRRNERQRLIFDVREVRHEIVKRLELLRVSIVEHHLHPPFRFSGKERNAHRLRPMHIGIVPAHHAQNSRDMEPADPHLDSAIYQTLRQVERMRELVRLHPDQHHHSRARVLDHPRQFLRPDPRVRLIERMNLDLHIRSERMPLLTIPRQPINRRQRVRRNRRSEPLDHITVVIVVRRLYENQAKAFRARRCKFSQPPRPLLSLAPSRSPRSQVALGNAVVFEATLRRPRERARFRLDPRRCDGMFRPWPFPYSP
jgi:hypothetical protein